MFAPKIKPPLKFGSISSFTIDLFILYYIFWKMLKTWGGMVEKTAWMKSVQRSIFWLSKSGSYQLRDSSVLMIIDTLSWCVLTTLELLCSNRFHISPQPFWAYWVRVQSFLLSELWYGYPLNPNTVVALSFSFFFSNCKEENVHNIFCTMFVALKHQDILLWRNLPFKMFVLFLFGLD